MSKRTKLALCRVGSIGGFLAFGLSLHSVPWPVSLVVALVAVVAFFAAVELNRPAAKD